MAWKASPVLLDTRNRQLSQSVIGAGGIAGAVNHAIKSRSVIGAGGIAGAVNHAIKLRSVIGAGGIAEAVNHVIKQEARPSSVPPCAPSWV